MRESAGRISAKNKKAPAVRMAEPEFVQREGENKPPLGQGGDSDSTPSVWTSQHTSIQKIRLDHLVVRFLIRPHADLTSKILEGRIAAEAMQHVDAPIRLFDAGYNVVSNGNAGRRCFEIRA